MGQLSESASHVAGPLQVRWRMDGYLQVPTGLVDTGPAVLVLLHHGRLPRNPRPSHGVCRRANDAAQAQHPGHPRQHQQQLLQQQLQAGQHQQQARLTPHVRRRGQRPRPLALANQVPQAPQTRPDLAHRQLRPLAARTAIRTHAHHRGVGFRQRQQR